MRTSNLFVPEILQKVTDSVIGHSRITVLQPWARLEGNRWALKIRARLSVPETSTISTETIWYLLFDSASASVVAYPAKVGGISQTYQHQSFNEEGPANEPWRRGNPCLQRQAAVFGRSAWTGEPQAIDEKILWYLDRLLVWLDAAACAKLNEPGEPLELPTGSGLSSFPIVGFTSLADDLPFWNGRHGQWGWADLARLPGSIESYVIKAFQDKERKPIRDVEWGHLISKQPACNKALWIALSSLPVVEPWELPRTWLALSSYLNSVGVNLGEMFVKVGADCRQRRMDNAPMIVLLGFPISATIGAKPTRYHWLAIGGLNLSDRRAKKNGFRATEKTRQFIDQSLASSTTAMRWVRTMNWSPEQIRTRAGRENVVCKRVLVIGAGALGSAVSENLVRMGIYDLGVLDADRLEVGNLTRHALGMDAVGHNKALALASALNLLMPDANVVGLASFFPPTRMEIAEQVRSFDVIVDCSGSDGVLDALSAFDWREEKTFISLGMTWKAEGLLAFTASETAFPTIDAKQRFADLAAPPTSLVDAPVEGIGCWHPVFPASASNVMLWSALGSQFIIEAIHSSERRCEYFRQLADGSVERLSG